MIQHQLRRIASDTISFWHCIFPSVTGLPFKWSLGSHLKGEKSPQINCWFNSNVILCITSEKLSLFLSFIVNCRLLLFLGNSPKGLLLIYSPHRVEFWVDTICIHSLSIPENVSIFLEFCQFPPLTFSYLKSAFVLRRVGSHLPFFWALIAWQPWCLLVVRKW